MTLAVPSAEGQFHEVLAKTFEDEEALFHPSALCQGFQQLRALIQAGAYGGVLPSIAPRESFKTLILPALSGYRRDLVRHWNKRQMERRNIGITILSSIANALVLRNDAMEVEQL